MTDKIIPSGDLTPINLPAFIVSNISSYYIIQQANLLFINLLQKQREDIIGQALDKVFPVSLEFRNYPHNHSLIGGIKKAYLSKIKTQVPPEHYVLNINDDKIFEINKWAFTITPVLKPDSSVDYLLVKVFEE